MGSWGGGYSHFTQTQTPSQTHGTKAPGGVSAFSLDVKHIYLLPDGNGEFTRKMGMLVGQGAFER